MAPKYVPTNTLLKSLSYALREHHPHCPTIFPIRPKTRRSAATFTHRRHAQAISILPTAVDKTSADFKDNSSQLSEIMSKYASLHQKIPQGGPDKARKKHVERGKMLARDRVTALIDPAAAAAMSHGHSRCSDELRPASAAKPLPSTWPIGPAAAHPFSLMRLEALPNGGFRLTENLPDNAVPLYAILSHRWENDDQEVTYGDMVKGLGRDKAGYDKIQFCGEQATRDDLQYFWVDSCCIDKSNEGEHQKANQSHVSLHWELDFQNSKWFTRGWTLQELLAPASVEFFSRNRARLGDKVWLQQPIQQKTGFSINERFSWIERRKTTLEEDKAYSLLGIFDVSIPIRYGEGIANAFKRLEDEINKQMKCIRDLRVTDPRDDKETD
ncbi:uncharacterized protein Z518_04477 [Rhinocladiella mackenziei CBS 650.93]|uniref:Heterokaryon incompatibility domain-containing protein n=1 Tax=Rhinocladiella mackenziei CBS 650.93 TaxID=1442369 RepID=A0A0D2ITN2_9EURO|nr:uncharacterized protein Z518_04477 [Rhinocladiella mackenziei CBS 650.93]KIX06501.1 hypothetical protein Z518_04477 [Rhinocladiella mackenziei CBS 650.93]